jgi:hypothetical protein
MTERQQYYKELIAHIVEKYYHVEIDISKASEVPLPNVRIDMVFDIPKQNLAKGIVSPFPCEQHRCFLPFQPLPVLTEAKEVIRKIFKKKPATQEELLLLFWLRRLQPAFYKEDIAMPRDMVEVINELCPEALQASRNKGKEEEKETIARNMLRKGLDLALIAEITGLNLDEISKLRQE